jgi:hypothetical protein
LEPGGLECGEGLPLVHLHEIDRVELVVEEVAGALHIVHAGHGVHAIADGAHVGCEEAGLLILPDLQVGIDQELL